MAVEVKTMDVKRFALLLNSEERMVTVIKRAAFILLHIIVNISNITLLGPYID